MNKKIVKSIISATLLTNSVMMLQPSERVEACDPVVTYQYIQETSSSLGNFGIIILAGGIVICGSMVLYDAYTVNNNIIQAKIPKLPKYGDPGSCIEKINKEGTVIQRRYYDEQGRAYIDIDLTDHGQPEYHPWEREGKKIHKHVWDWTKNPKDGQRGAGEELTDYDYFKYVMVPRGMIK